MKHIEPRSKSRPSRLMIRRRCDRILCGGEKFATATSWVRHLRRLPRGPRTAEWDVFRIQLFILKEMKTVTHFIYQYKKKLVSVIHWKTSKSSNEPG